MSTITIKSDKPMVVIPVEEYESMKETIELIQMNPRIAGQLRKEHEKIEAGDYVDFDEYKKKHGIRNKVKE